MAFSLELPKEDEIRDLVKKETAPTEERKESIADHADNNSRAFIEVDISDSAARHECVQAIETFGMEALKKSDSNNAILKKRMYQFSEPGSDSGDVTKGLEDLTMRMRDLDPSQVDFLKKGVLGKLTKPVRRYFEKFRTADEEISEILKSLDKGKRVLQQDNTTLELEQGSMRDLTKQLNELIVMGMDMDEALENAVTDMQTKGEDPEKIRFLQEEVIYPLRQRVQDFQQLLTVDQQGIIAMEIIRRNNRELIRSVDRAKLVTVSALRTAVTVAGALYDQKITLEKIKTLNEETDRMISATSTLLRTQGTEIHQQAEDANISADTLRQAFSDAIAALDEISAYKQEALPRIKQSIADFKELADEGERRIQALENGVT